MNITVRTWKQLDSDEQLRLLEIVATQNWMGKFSKGIGSQTAKFASQKG